MPQSPSPAVVPDAATAPLAVASSYAPRHLEKHPYATALAPPARLSLQSLPGERAYAVVSFWEERLPELVKRTTLEKTVRLAATRQPNGQLRVAYTAAAPVFRKPDVSSFERVLLLLAALYQHLELRVAPSGQLLAVLNGAEIQQTWETVKQELVRRSGGEDEFTQVLIAGLDEQLPRPDAVRDSLRLDYFFGFLLQNLYEQRFENSLRYGQARAFPEFFAGVDLWCWEQLELVVPGSPERVAVRLTGRLDPTRTNLAAVARQLAESRQLLVADDAPPPLPTALRFSYEATAELDAATGWPVQVEAAVRCWVEGGYSKEYFLRLEQQPLQP